MFVNKGWVRSSAIALFLLPQSLFAQRGLDSKWISFDRAGAENSPLQCFKPSNVTVSDGNLVLTSKVETATCSSIDLPQKAHNYTSAFVAMRDFHFLYGSVEVRAKFAGGNHSGAWPTIWLADASCQPSDPTGTDDHCNEEEIDIAEMLDGNFTQVNQQIHVQKFKYNDSCKPQIADASRSFHTYRLDWSPGQLAFKIDGKTTCTMAKPYVPDGPMYLKISVYVGGYGGPVNDKTMPWVSLIDYVKITQDNKVIFEDQFDGVQSAQDHPVKQPVKTGSLK